MLTSKFENGKLVYVENSEYKEYCNKNENYKGIIWALPHKATQERTVVQNSAMHKWFELVAKELNESGQTIQMVLTKTMELDWNKNTVKEIMWRSVQIALLQKESTKDLDKVNDINEIYEHLNKFLAEKCNGIHVPWPHDPTKVK